MINFIKHDNQDIGICVETNIDNIIEKVQLYNGKEFFNLPEDLLKFVDKNLFKISIGRPFLDDFFPNVNIDSCN